MEPKGFTVHPHHDPPSALALEFTAPMISPPLATAQDVGYRIGVAEPSAPEAAETSQPADDAFSLLPRGERDRYYVALAGTSDGHMAAANNTAFAQSCLGQAMSLTRVARSGDVVNMTTLHQQMQRRYDEDARVREVDRRWSECVRADGRPQFAGPAEAYSYAEYFHYPVGGRPPTLVPDGGPWQPAVARAKEIELAVVDATCADQTGLREVCAGVWSQTVSAVLAAREADIYARRDQLSNLLEAAQQRLAT
jgi:hypothetical protein